MKAKLHHFRPLGLFDYTYYKISKVRKFARFARLMDDPALAAGKTHQTRSWSDLIVSGDPRKRPQMTIFYLKQDLCLCQREPV